MTFEIFNEELVNYPVKLIAIKNLLEITPQKMLNFLESLMLSENVMCFIVIVKLQAVVMVVVPALRGVGNPVLPVRRIILVPTCILQYVNLYPVQFQLLNVDP